MYLDVQQGAIRTGGYNREKPWVGEGEGGAPLLKSILNQKFIKAKAESAPLDTYRLVILCYK